MAIQIQVDEVGERLSELLNRTALGGERIIVERDGKPIAAVVSAEDLQRLENGDAASLDTEEAREARFRQLLKAAGIVVHFPTGELLTPEERRLIRIEGPPLSEQIIEDRKTRDELLSGQ
jgi:prevent-host-death family protein